MLSTSKASAQSIPTNLPYSVNVESWWNTHPFNPESANYIPIGNIPNPQPILNVKTQYGGNIQSAIEALPSTGGTLYFETGEYQNGSGYNNGAFELVGKSDVHFVGPTDKSAVIKGGIAYVVGCQEAKNYSSFVSYLVHGDRNATLTQNILKCATVNALKNIYFKNLTFDGGNLPSVNGSLEMRGVNGVVFDNVLFRNYAASSQPNYTGSINASSMIHNVWFRGVTFQGPHQNAFYLDGCHFCGVLESQFHFNFLVTTVNFFPNTDSTADLNGNGRIDSLTQEDRISNYVVSSHNIFGSAGPLASIGNLQTINASNVLILKNNLQRPANSFVRFAGKCQTASSQQLLMYGSMNYLFNNFRVVGNTVKDAKILTVIDGTRYGCTTSSTMDMGKYQILDNNLTGTTTSLYTEINTISGPNSICNNTLNGTFYPNTNCAVISPTQIPPTPTPNSPTLTPTTSGTDLVVTDITWTPLVVNTGTQLVFKAIVKNQGTSSSPNGTIHGVLFSIDGQPVTWSDTYTFSLPPGGSITLTANGGPTSVNYWTASSGTHTVTAYVDDVKRILESNEGNNTLDKSITISSCLTGDTDCDGKVDFTDIKYIIGKYATADSVADIDTSAKVNSLDIVSGIKNTTISPTASSPTSGVTPTLPAGTFFPLGVYEHARASSWCIQHSSDTASCPSITRQYTSDQLGLYDADLAPMISNLKLHNLDTIMFNYNQTPRDDSWWTSTDVNNLNILFGASLADNWFNNTQVNQTLDTAKQILQPIISSTNTHSSIKGYNLIDESNGDTTSVSKLSLMNQAVHDLAPGKKSSAVFIGIDRTNNHLKTVNTDIPVMDLYPYGLNNPKCDTHMTGFGLPNWDFTDYLRYILKDKSTTVPFWVILQGHRWTTTSQFALRKPSAAEMRLQHWLAVGEGAKGIIWFMYSPFVTPDANLDMPGLNAPENQDIYNEVSALALRTKSLSNILLSTHKIITGTVPISLGGQDPRLISYDEKFTASAVGGGNVYVSTLTDGNKYYAVVANRSCSTETETKQIAISSSVTGRLRDLETQTIYNLGQGITFRAGDGKIFVLE